MAIDMVERNFGRLPRNSAVGDDQGESFQLAPSSRNVGIESAEGPEHWESSRESSPQSFADTSTNNREGITYDSTTHVRVRSKLSPAEEIHWKKAEKDPFLKKGRRGGLEVFPKFFSNYQEVGLELKQGLFNIWSTFLIAGTLLVSIAMQPFVTNIPNLGGWKLKVYGGFWMMVIVTDLTSLIVTGFFLGYLHAYPGKLTYMWMCNIGQWAGIPSLLIMIGAVITLGAIAFSSWVIYGSELGLICAGVEVLVVLFSWYTASSLAKAARAMEALE